MGRVHQQHIRAGRQPDNFLPIVTHGSAERPLPPGVSLPEQVTVALQEIAVDARAGLLAFAVGVGSEVFHTLLEENVSELVGEKGRHQAERQAYRHGHEPSSLTLGGRKVIVDKPRVRSCQGAEVGLPLWKAFSEQDIAATMVLERMLAGVATRRHGDVAESGGLDRRQSLRDRQALLVRRVKQTSWQCSVRSPLSH